MKVVIFVGKSITVPAGHGLPGCGPYRIVGAVAGDSGEPAEPDAPCCPVVTRAPLSPDAVSAPARPFASPFMSKWLMSGNGTP